jgi:hypothetical protein
MRVNEPLRMLSKIIRSKGRLNTSDFRILKLLGSALVGIKSNKGACINFVLKM